MSTDPDDIHQSNVELAAGMLEITQHRLVRDYPFHASFVSRWRLHPTFDIDTLGVAVKDAAIQFYYNPDFIVKCSFPELIGALHHEVNHLLFGHVFLDRTRFPDSDSLIIAEEVTVNEWIREPLPGYPILLKDFPQLPPNEDTVTRYNRLVSTPKNYFRKTDSVDIPSYSQSNSAEQRPNFVPNKLKKVPDDRVPGTVFPFDDHSLWNQSTPSLVERVTLSIMISDAVEQLTDEQKANLSPMIRQHIHNITSGIGTPSGLEIWSSTTGSSVNWKKLLRQYLQEATELRPIFTRPPRRFPELIGVIPGRIHHLSCARVMVVIDTSGSMSSQVLKAIATEVEYLIKLYDVTIVQCDFQIQGVYPVTRGSMVWKEMIQYFKGRGGTDLRPPFTSGLLGKINPDVVLFFTDGYGPAPESAPYVPVIWCLLPEGQRPVEWGRVVYLPDRCL